MAWNHLGSWIPGTHQLVAMEFFHTDGKSHQFKDNISTSWGKSVLRTTLYCVLELACML